MLLSIPSHLSFLVQFVAAVVLPLFLTMFKDHPLSQWCFPSKQPWSEPNIPPTFNYVCGFFILRLIKIYMPMRNHKSIFVQRFQIFDQDREKMVEALCRVWRRQHCVEQPGAKSWPWQDVCLMGEIWWLWVFILKIIWKSNHSFQVPLHVCFPIIQW